MDGIILRMFLVSEQSVAPFPSEDNNFSCTIFSRQLKLLFYLILLKKIRNHFF